MQIEKAAGKKCRVYHYTDEMSDEFSAPSIKARKIDDTYNYSMHTKFFCLKRFLLYRVIATPLAYLFCKLKLGLKIKNKVVRKKASVPFFIYANHTQQTADAYIQSLAFFPHDIFVITHADNVSMPILRNSTAILGAIPLPDTKKAAHNFKASMESHLKSGACIAIYPEAHIWPYYTKIRPFPKDSFSYPVRYSMPVFASTTTYKKRRFFKKPRAVVYIDGPFFPDESLSYNERVEKLHREVYLSMCKRAEESNCEYIRYVKVVDADKSE